METGIKTFEIMVLISRLVLRLKKQGGGIHVIETLARVTAHFLQVFYQRMGILMYVISVQLGPKSSMPNAKISPEIKNKTNELAFLFKRNCNSTLPDQKNSKVTPTYLKTSLLRRLLAQNLPNATPLIGQIHSFSKMTITFELLMGF